MKKKVKKALSWVLLAAALVFLGLSAWQAWGYYRTEKTTDRALALAGVEQQAPQKTEASTTPAPTEPAVTTAPQQTQLPAPEDPLALAWSEPLAQDAWFLMDVQLAPLQAENKDVIGWICIPGTKLSYPLLQGTDNERYLRRAWDGSWSAAGSIFLECTNDPNLLDFNTIVYGHHMANGSCFAPIINYRDPAFLAEHRWVYIVTENDIRRYEIFSAYEAPLDSDTYRMNFTGEKRKQAALDHYIQSSLWEGAVTPDTASYILTLSTCVGNGQYKTRFVVQAVLTGVFKA